jgi:hypothetical protein
MNIVLEYNLLIDTNLVSGYNISTSFGELANLKHSWRLRRSNGGIADMASHYDEDDSDNIAVGRETWEIVFQDVLEKSPEFAEGLARVLFSLRRVIERGPEGVAESGNSLREGIEFAYLYTDAHRAALELFLLYIGGHLEVPDEPHRLIVEAVARGTLNAKRSLERGRKKQARKSKS